jgi:SAM-dependent methyltransferase
MTEAPSPRDLVSSSAHTSLDYRRKALPRPLVRRMLRSGQNALYRRYEEHFPPDPSDRVLDLGVNASLEERRDYFFESLYPYPSQVVAAGLEPPDRFSRLFPQVRYVQVRRDEPYPFAEDSFDIVFCNAVVEHVGSRDVQRRFLTDVFGIGSAAFVTTPNRWFPVEVHTVLPFVHWLPTPVYRRLFRLLGFRFFAQEANLNLLDRRSLSQLVPAGIEANVDLLRILGWPSNLLLVGRREKK